MSTALHDASANGSGARPGWGEPSRAPASRSTAPAGYSLIELLVAAALAAVALTAAWSWCWSVSGVAQRRDAAAEARSSVAYARRFSEAELRQATVVSTPELPSSRSSLAVTIPSPGGGQADDVTYVYDSGRGVLWRKSPGSYLASEVTRFSITYYDAGGDKLEPGAEGRLASEAAALVRRIGLELAVSEHGQGWSEAWSIALRACR